VCVCMFLCRSVCGVCMFCAGKCAGCVHVFVQVSVGWCMHVFVQVRAVYLCVRVCVRIHSVLCV